MSSQHWTRMSTPGVGYYWNHLTKCQPQGKFRKHSTDRLKILTYPYQAVQFKQAPLWSYTVVVQSVGSGADQFNLKKKMLYLFI